MDDFSQFRPEEKTVYDDSYFMRKNTETKTLRKLSFYAGLAVILYVFIQNVIIVIIEGLGLIDLYTKNSLFQSGTDIFLIILGILLPFSLLGKKMQKASGEAEPVLMEPVKRKKILLYGIFGCTGCVILANIFSSYITYFISLIGYELDSPDIQMPDGMFGFAVTMLRVSILAAVVEEFCLRGHVMGNLRRYGDVFAVLMSSAIFALMHGNLIQVPFAMFSGVALGIFSIKTGSIWPAIMAHAINNGLSVAISYLIKIVGEEPGMLLYSYAMYVLIFIGLVAAFAFAMNTKDRPLKRGNTVLKPFEKTFHYLFTAPTVVAFLIMVTITAQSVS